MATFALLIDRSPSFLDAGKERASLLLVRVGIGTLMEYWRDRLLQADVESLVIVPRFSFGQGYTQAIKNISSRAVVLRLDRLEEHVRGHELTDRLLMIDPAFYPVNANEMLAPLAVEHDRFVTHLTCQLGERATIQERVVVDGDRRVQRIERLYGGVTNLRSAKVACSVLSVAAARCLRAPDYHTPGDVRTALVSAGLPTRDVPLTDLVIDAGCEQGLLNLSTYLLWTASNPPPSASLEQVKPGIWAAPRCRIHPAGRLRSPAIICRDSTVQARARVIGPTVVGVGAMIGSGATVSRCIVGDHVRVPAGARLANRVLATNPNGSPPSRFASWTSHLAAEQTEHALHQITESPQSQGSWAERFYRASKRLFDFTAALCGLIVLSPLLGAVAVLVKCTSPGPVFFGHSRESRGGRPFRCWKFRTMVDRAHAQQRALYSQNAVDGPQFKLANDPRVTSLGRFLRTTNIDELPQLYNVLRGEMSLVGPRPSPFRENQICIPWREARLSVLPGITGLWQVCRHDRDTGDFHQWIYYDVLYARHRSFALDMRILIATLLTLGGRWGVPVSWVIPGYRPAKGVGRADGTHRVGSRHSASCAVGA